MNLAATALDKSDVLARLVDANVSENQRDAILSALPTRALGVILYGSVARGDSSDTSDVDLLVISPIHEATRAVGRVNVTTYDESQFNSAAGTIYGMHVARDGLLLHDSGGIGARVRRFGPVDVDRARARLSSLAALLALPDEELKRHLPGFVRHARYVLRTAIYLAAIRDDDPCFSVKELADRANDEALTHLLSSHPEVHGEPTWDVLMELRRRVREESLAEVSIRYRTLADTIVGLGTSDPEIADAATLILNRDPGDPYAVIPRVIL